MAADLTSNPGDAREYADAFQETFNTNAETLRQYANDRLNASDIVAAIRFADRQEDQSKRYLVASANEATGWSRYSRCTALWCTSP